MLNTSANAVLVKLGLPIVSVDGLNVENYWYQGGRTGEGRFRRTEYVWPDYGQGLLTFKRVSLGCPLPPGHGFYDCLATVVVERGGVVRPASPMLTPVPRRSTFR